MPSSGIIWNFQPATVIGLPCLVTTTMRTGSAGKQGYVGKSRQRLAAQLMRQAGCDLPRICCDLPRISRSCGSRSACLVSACVVSALSNVGLQKSTLDVGRPSKHPATSPPLASRLAELDLSEIAQGVPSRAHERRAFASRQPCYRKEFELKTAFAAAIALASVWSRAPPPKPASLRSTASAMAITAAAPHPAPGSTRLREILSRWRTSRLRSAPG